jgi:hypothetical protein
LCDVVATCLLSQWLFRGGQFNSCSDNVEVY